MAKLSEKVYIKYLSIWGENTSETVRNTNKIKMLIKLHIDLAKPKSGVKLS